MTGAFGDPAGSRHSTDAAGSRSPADSAPRARRRVLVVDDEQTIAELIREVLKRHDIEVDTSTGGEASIDVAEAGGYGLVISDYAIPGLNGLEFVRRLRERDVDGGVLIVSAFLDPETIVALESEPRVVGLLRKPFDIFELVQRVEAHFRSLSLGVPAREGPPAERDARTRPRPGATHSPDAAQSMDRAAFSE